MQQNYPILLAIRPIPFQGEREVGDRWDDLVRELRARLRADGVEAGDSTHGLLLFNYDHPFTALSSLFEKLAQLKKEYGQKQAGELPLQVVVHLEKKGEVPPPFRNASSPLWEGLQAEKPYLSRSLKVQWDALMAGRKLPAHTLEDTGNGLFLLQLRGKGGLRRQRLFAPRRQLVLPGQTPCFYCGMGDHAPAACPSKLLTMETRAIHEVGYQPLAEIGERFQEALAARKQIEETLAPGATLSQIRQNPVLQAFVAYFDLSLVYQPRYLWHIAFSLHQVWDGAGQSTRVKVDSRHLQGGLDSLRVGQYRQAREQLLAENQLMGGKQFYATVGLAMVALEQQRPDEMAQHLEIAKGLASQEKEKIYISLLRARYHELTGHAWKAEHALQPVLNLYVDCYEVLYRKVQMQVRAGEGVQALRLLGKLVESDRRFFITALMDPALLPIEGLVDDLLRSHFVAARTEAGESLALAREEYLELQEWFAEEDPDLLDNLKALANLEKQFARRTYYDFLDVARRGRSLLHAAPRLREAKLDELNDQVDKVALRWEEYAAFWKGYPYQGFFRSFLGRLTSAKRRLIESRSLAADNLAAARGRLEAARENLAPLASLADRMQKLRIGLDTLKVFGGQLLLSELALTALLFLLLPVVTVLLPDLFSSDFLRQVRDRSFQRTVIFVTNLLIGPMVAFALTVRKIGRF